jgi:predicted phosphodiesterase
MFLLALQRLIVGTVNVDMGHSHYRLLTRSAVVVNPGSDFIESRLAPLGSSPCSEKL